MPSKRANDVKHPPVEWRGVTLTQWYATSNTAHLRGGNPRDNDPDLRLSVKYLKGIPDTYDATVSLGQVTCSVFRFAKPDWALDEVAERVQRLAHWLTINKE
jgi:hypothetical protein